MFERIRNNSVMRRIFAFQQTPFYLGALAVVALVSNVFGLDFLGFYVLGLTAIFTLLFNPDTKPIVAPIAFMIFSVSVQHAPTKENPTGFYTSAPVLTQLVLLMASVIILIVVRLILKGSLKKTWKGASLGGGLVAISAGLLLNGAFYKGYHILNLALGIGFAFLFLIVYLFFIHTMQWDGKSVRYLAWFMLIMGLLISAQLGCRYLTCPRLMQTFDKDLVTLGWSISNSIAYVLLITLPFGFYFMRSAKLNVVYYLCTLVIFIAIVFTFSRGSLVIAVPLFIGGMVYTCFAAKEKITPVAFSAAMLVLAVVLIIVCREKIFKILNFYIETGLNDRGRFELWKDGLTAFMRSPVFGVGQMFDFATGSLATFHWYHNTLVQFLVTGGIVGLGTYMYHRVETVVLFLRKPTLNRFFIGISVAALIANSLLDVAMSMPHMIFFYSVLLAFAEKDYQTVTGRPQLTGGGKGTNAGKPAVHAVGDVAILSGELDGGETAPQDAEKRKDAENEKPSEV